MPTSWDIVEQARAWAYEPGTWAQIMRRHGKEAK